MTETDQKHLRHLTWEPGNKSKGIPHDDTATPHSDIQQKILDDNMTIHPNTVARIPEDNAVRAEQEWK